MRVLDLFSGIGGFSLGLEKAGMKTRAFCEIDGKCEKILNKHWPKVPVFKNIEKLVGDPNFIEVICGGYPCTGHSVAGKKEGLNNKASSLWSEYARLIKEIRPKYVIIENSPNLRSTGLVTVLQDLDARGYNAEFQIISGYSVGAPHQRERIYIVAWRKDLPYCDPFRFWQTYNKKEESKQKWWAKRLFKRDAMFGEIPKIESRILRDVDGLPKESLKAEEERIKQLGNAVIPQIPYLIGKAIMESNKEVKCNFCTKACGNKWCSAFKEAIK